MGTKETYEKRYIKAYQTSYNMTKHIIQLKNNNIKHIISCDGIFFQKRYKSRTWYWMVHPDYVDSIDKETQYTDVIGFEVPGKKIIAVDKKYDKILKKIKYKFLK